MLLFWPVRKNFGDLWDFDLSDKEAEKCNSNKSKCVKYNVRVTLIKVNVCDKLL